MTQLQRTIGEAMWRHQQAMDSGQALGKGRITWDRISRRASRLGEVGAGEYVRVVEELDATRQQRLARHVDN